ncbi:MAG: hypothetical protein WCC21_03660 [Candidatus Acidiferrales bacterium]
MRTGPDIRSACSEEFGELCALFTAAALDAPDYERLEAHLRVCDKCRTVLGDYNSLATEGMAKIAAAVSDGDESAAAEHIWTSPDAQANAKELLLRTLQVKQANPGVFGTPAHNHLAGIRATRASSWGSRQAALLKVAAVLILGVAVGYGIGFKKSRSGHAGQAGVSSVASSQDAELQTILTQRKALNAQLATNSQTIADLNERSQRDEKEMAELKEAKASLEKATSELSSTNEQQAGSLDSISTQRNDLQHKLQDAEQSLQNVQNELNKSQEERQKTLLQTASLESRIGELTAQLRETSESSDREKDFLASDRDIRDLMGARQLYIADVFDVDHNGKKRKPFGRVFYTKGKSLIFYAFDLDEQAGPRDAKTFEVWGSPYADQSSPVSLGIFYMDNEANRRWVFKSDDPNALAQINALFVTVEPNGKSKTPSGKPFLYAYLRTAPANHP